ncbi:hypothetical protein GGR56DRAFT_674637 [Xylariaceae sp. FL0804]|nr:hypothetical protein GGR56DRAFT_674637 [Xylariaceae sp. FL0804]
MSRHLLAQAWCLLALIRVGLSSPSFFSSPFSSPEDVANTSISTTDWAGAILVPVPLGDTTGAGAMPAVTQVLAGWSVPQLCLAVGQDTTDAHPLEVWIGISGQGCATPGAMIQAGYSNYEDGSTVSEAWFSWYPPVPRVQLSGFEGYERRWKTENKAVPGEDITVEIELYNVTNGHVTFSNMHSGVTAGEDISTPNASIADFNMSAENTDPHGGRRCNGAGAAWAVVQGATSGSTYPPETGETVDTMPGYIPVQFDNFEAWALGSDGTPTTLADAGSLFRIQDGTMADTIAYGDEGFEVYTNRLCADGSTPP